MVDDATEVGPIDSSKMQLWYHATFCYTVFELHIYIAIPACIGLIRL